MLLKILFCDRYFNPLIDNSGLQNFKYDLYECTSYAHKKLNTLKK